jgi:hypothetical protein
MFERPARQTRQDQRLLWPGVLKHSEDLDLEFLDPIPGENRPASPAHAGFHVIQRKKPGLSGERASQREDRWDQKAGHKPIVQGARAFPGARH